MQNNKDEDFYITCGSILDLDTKYIEPQIKNRWCDRNPGNGRYPGYGLIRRFGSNTIHVSFRIIEDDSIVKINKIFTSEDAVFDFLKSIKK